MFPLFYSLCVFFKVVSADVVIVWPFYLTEHYDTRFFITIQYNVSILGHIFHIFKTIHLHLSNLFSLLFPLTCKMSHTHPPVEYFTLHRLICFARSRCDCTTANPLKLYKNARGRVSEVSTSENEACLTPLIVRKALWRCASDIAFHTKLQFNLPCDWRSPLALLSPSTSTAVWLVSMWHHWPRPVSSSEQEGVLSRSPFLHESWPRH